jgi:hypothetical protein
MTYNEIIEEQRNILPLNRNWWPKYFFHFTDIRNALGIIEKGWIYARNVATEQNIMCSNNASDTVLELSHSEIKEYARLYFRPRTPTQYNNEGYKPKMVRKPDFNANCPVPIFFILDSNKVLNMDGVMFSETSCAGTSNINLLSGEKSYENLPFDKIYHDGVFLQENRDDIVKHRQAEIVRLDGIPINECLKGIVCRSIAEKHTLLYLLRTQNLDKYNVYRSLIQCAPKLKMFYDNGIYISNVEFDEKLLIKLNDPYKRYSYNNSNTPVNCVINIFYVDNNKIINRAVHSGTVDYKKCEMISVDVLKNISQNIIVEISFDGILMYKNQINISIDNVL